AARGATGRRSAGASRARAHGDEPAGRVEDVAAAELRHERVRLEHALIDLPPRPVLEDAFLPALARLASVPHAADDDELRRHASRLAEEAVPVLLDEVAVEVARKEALEALIRKGEVERIPHDERRVRRLPAGNLDHRLALVEADDLAR